MKNLIVVVLMITSVLSYAQEDPFLSEIGGLFAFNAGQITSLADAMPADKFDWAPAEGVRDVTGVLMHLAQLNYMAGNYFGATMPEGFDIASLETVSGKEEAMRVATESFEFAQGYMASADPTTLGDEVELPFGTFTKRQLLMIIYEHSGEHKGQLIAYARANGITPPWSVPAEEKE